MVASSGVKGATWVIASQTVIGKVECVTSNREKMQQPIKKRKLLNPPTPHKWTCLQTLLGPSCVDFDSNPTGQGEFKTYEDYKISDCYLNPRQFGFEEEGILDLLSSYLDASSVGVLSSHDRESAALLSNRLAIANLSELITDGFLTSIHAASSIKPAVKRFWQKMRQMIIKPRDDIEAEAARLSLVDIVRTLDRNPGDVDPPFGSYLKMVAGEDDEFISAVTQLLGKHANPFLWLLAKGYEERTIEFTKTTDLNQLKEWWPRKATEDNLLDLIVWASAVIGKWKELNSLDPLISAIANVGHEVIGGPTPLRDDTILPGYVFDFAVDLLREGVPDEILSPIASLLTEPRLKKRVGPYRGRDLIYAAHDVSEYTKAGRDTRLMDRMLSLLVGMIFGRDVDLISDIQQFSGELALTAQSLDLANLEIEQDTTMQ